MGFIDLFDTMWIYEVASSAREYQRVAQNKRAEIQLDTSVILRWALYVRSVTAPRASAMLARKQQ